MIDGLIGNADNDKIAGNKDSIVTFSELASYVEEKVSNWALDKGKKQKPYTQIFGEKFGELALSAYVLEDRPADVKAVESKGWQVDKNDKGFWEADYGDGIIMVYIPVGEFTMGSNEGDVDEKPPHKVYVDGYWMGKTEVTVKQYKSFISKSRYQSLPSWVFKYSPGDDYPIVGVTWDDAKAYCKVLSKRKGIIFKLPTEAQWEKAA